MEENRLEIGEIPEVGEIDVTSVKRETTGTTERETEEIEEVETERRTRGVGRRITVEKEITETRGVERGRKIIEI